MWNNGENSNTDYVLNYNKMCTLVQVNRDFTFKKLYLWFTYPYYLSFKH